MNKHIKSSYVFAFIIISWNIIIGYHVINHWYRFSFIMIHLCLVDDTMLNKAIFIMPGCWKETVSRATGQA